MFGSESGHLLVSPALHCDESRPYRRFHLWPASKAICVQKITVGGTGSGGSHWSVAFLPTFFLRMLSIKALITLNVLTDSPMSVCQFRVFNTSWKKLRASSAYASQLPDAIHRTSRLGSRLFGSDKAESNSKPLCRTTTTRAMIVIISYHESQNYTQWCNIRILRLLRQPHPTENSKRWIKFDTTVPQLKTLYHIPQHRPLAAWLHLAVAISHISFFVYLSSSLPRIQGLSIALRTLGWGGSSACAKSTVQTLRKLIDIHARERLYLIQKTPLI